MPPVEDTREARERANRLLADVAAGIIVRTLRADMPYGRVDDLQGVFPLDPADQDTTADLHRRALVETIERGDLAGINRPVVLTDKGRAVLGAPVELPSPPPLLCDGVVHAQGEQPPAVVVAAETAGGMKRMVLCRDCGQRYALDAACLALARFELDPSVRPVAIHLIPLPQAGTP